MIKDIKICLKQWINEDDYRAITELKNICTRKKELYLKLELELKLSLPKPDNIRSLYGMNEFMCYSKDLLIGYLGIFNLGGSTAELTGMVHPYYRRRGIFTRLYRLALEECRLRNFKRILWTCDRRSFSGQAFLQRIGTNLSFSEYIMKHKKQPAHSMEENISLRRASYLDMETIMRINYTCFGMTGYTGIMPEEEAEMNRITYMIEEKSRVIGKIRTEINGQDSIISGFGILPQYQGKGYGKQALKSAIDILVKKGITNIGLQVATENKKAIRLYKSCGFVKESILDYYLPAEFDIIDTI